MDFNVLTSCCDPKFAVKAYANHLESVRATYQKLKDLIALAAITDESDIESTPTAYFTDRIEDEGFNPQAYVTLPIGEFTLLSLLLDIYNGSEEYANGSESDMDFLITDNDGNGIGYVSFIDAITNTLHSVTAAWAASASALETSVSARISLFRDKMQTIFADAYDDISNSIEYWTAVLSENFTPSQWINTAIATMQLEDVADEVMRIDETNLYEYTGASPIGALDFSTAASAAMTVGSVALRAYIGICDGIMNLGKKLFSWGAQKIIEVVNDPDDLYISNDQATEQSINDGYWSFNNVSWDITMDGAFYTLSNVFPDYSTMKNFAEGYFNEHYTNSWIHIKLICSELFIQIQSFQFYSNHMIIRCNYRYRPKVLDYSKVRTFAQASGAPGSSSTYYNLGGGGTKEQWMGRLAMLQTADIFADSNTSEFDKINGLILATNWTMSFSSTCLSAITDHNTFYGNLYSKNGAPDYYVEVNTPTNADFVKWGIGFQYDNGRHEWTPINNWMSNTTPCEYLLMFFIHAWEKYNNPLTYSFIPYTKDSEEFAPGQWSIKTNSMNWEAFNKFATNAIYAAIIIVAAIYAGVKISKWKKKKYLQRASYIGTIDNKMWSGQPISTAEWSKYIKYTRKLNVSTLMDNRLARVKEVVSNLKDKISSVGSTSAENKDNSVSIKSMVSNIGEAVSNIESISNETKDNSSSIIRLIKGQ